MGKFTQSCQVHGGYGNDWTVERTGVGDCGAHESGEGKHYI